MDSNQDFDEMEEALSTLEPAKVLNDMLPSKLEKPTQDLVNLIFDKDMFNSALKKYDLGNLYGLKI